MWVIITYCNKKLLNIEIELTCISVASPVQLRIRNVCALLANQFSAEFSFSSNHFLADHFLSTSQQTTISYGLPDAFELWNNRPKSIQKTKQKQGDLDDAREITAVWCWNVKKLNFAAILDFWQPCWIDYRYLINLNSMYGNNYLYQFW